MINKINKKYFLKSILPNWALHYARRARAWTAAWNYWSAYVFKQGRANPPEAVTFEATYRCNLSCAMCPQAFDLKDPDSLLRAQMKENRELETEQIVDVIRQAGGMGVKSFTITGGEPFLRKDILELTSAVKEKEMTSNIISNGGLMNDRYARELVTIGVDKITFSLDGPEKIHNSIRGNERQFQDLMGGVRQIQAEKRRQKRNVPDISFSMTVSALNAGSMPDLVEIAAKEKVGVNFGYVFYTSKEMKLKTERMFPATGGKLEDQDIPGEIRDVDVIALSKEIAKTERLANELGVKINIQPPIKEPKELHSRFFDDEYAYVHSCFYPWYALRINPYGDVYPCQMNVKMGSILEEKLGEIWNKEKYVHFRRELRKVGIWPQCAKCCALNDKLWDRLPKMDWYWKER